MDRHSPFMHGTAEAIARGVAMTLTLPVMARRKLLAIQAGALGDPQNAERLLRRMEAAGFKGFTVESEA